jgi:hypothetical protein
MGLDDLGLRNLDSGGLIWCRRAFYHMGDHMIFAILEVVRDRRFAGMFHVSGDETSGGNLEPESLGENEVLSLELRMRMILYYCEQSVMPLSGLKG